MRRLLLLPLVLAGLIAVMAQVGPGPIVVNGIPITPSSVTTTTLAINAVGSLGYAAGSGGVVTQLTSRSTSVTLNKPTGQITLFAAAPVVGTPVSFTVSDTSVAAADTVVLSVATATNTYEAIVTAVAGNSFQITVTSLAGTTSDSPVINFTLVKGSAS